MTDNKSFLTSRTSAKKEDISFLGENGNITNGVMNLLSTPPDEYKENEVMDKLLEISMQDSPVRFMYGSISVFIFTAKPDTVDLIQRRIRDIALTVKDNDDLKKILTKLYDHIDLAIHQVNKINTEISNSIKNATVEAKNDIMKEVDNKTRETERTYVGAFATIASILFGLVGGLAFSFQSINKVGSDNILNLIAVVCVIGAFIVGMLSMLVWIILPLTHRSAADISNFKESAKKIVEMLFACAVMFAGLSLLL